MKNVLGLLVVAGLASSTMASVVNTNVVASVTFTNKASIDAQGDTSNAVDSWVSTYGGAITGVRVTGSLTEVNTATFASEARVRLSAGAGSSFTGYNLQATTVGGFTGTIAVGPTVVNQASSLTNGGVVNFEWFESFQDGTADLAESTWNTVTYDFVNGSAIVNGNFALGAVAGNGTPVVASGSNVAGGLDFYTVSFPSGVFNVGDYLSILTRQPAGAAAYDSEIAIYDAAGNLVAEDDDGASGPGFYSRLSFGAADPILGDTAPGFNGLTLANGNYTIVVGGFNTVFGANIGSITAGAAAGAYELVIQTVPTPGSLALLGLGGLAAARRRRN